jgi:hypothetical protein
MTGCEQVGGWLLGTAQALVGLALITSALGCGEPAQESTKMGGNFTTATVHIDGFKKSASGAT